MQDVDGALATREPTPPELSQFIATACRSLIGLDAIISQIHRRLDG